MALVFVDGFDQRSTTTNGATIDGRKWYPTNEPNNLNRPGRFGAFACHVRQYLRSKDFTDQATYIMGFALFRTRGLGTSTTNNSAILAAFKQDEFTHCWLAINTDDRLQVYGDGVGTAERLLGTGSIPIRPGYWYYIEVKATIHTSTGAMEARVNGITDINVSNVNTHSDEPTAPAANTANNIMIPTDLSYGGTITESLGVISINTTNTSAWYVDDFYLADTTGSVNNDFLGEIYIETLFPDGAGNYTNWTANTGSNFQAVDEVEVDDDTTYVSETTASDIDTYTYGNIVTNTTILGVNINLETRFDDGGPHSIATVTRISATDYTGTTQSVPGSTYDNVPQLYDQSPATASAWTVSEINGAEFGMQMIS